MGKLHLPVIDYDKEKEQILKQHGLDLQSLLNKFSSINGNIDNPVEKNLINVLDKLLAFDFFLSDNFSTINSLCILMTQLLSGNLSGDMTNYLSELRKYNYSERCGVVWTYNYYAYRCRTCGLSISMSLCEECFTAGNHQGHDYNKFRSCAGGACDCGESNVLHASGFCPHHGPDKASRRPVPPAHLVFQLKTILRPLLRGLLTCLWSMAGPHFFSITQAISNENNGSSTQQPSAAALPASSTAPQSTDNENLKNLLNNDFPSAAAAPPPSSSSSSSAYFSVTSHLPRSLHKILWQKLRPLFQLLSQLHASGWLAQDSLSSVLLDQNQFIEMKQSMQNHCVYELYKRTITFFSNLLEKKNIQEKVPDHNCLMDAYIFALLPLNFPEDLTVLLIGLLTIADYKTAFMYSFVDHYSCVAVLIYYHFSQSRMFSFYSLPCPIALKDRIVHISVQIFSAKNLAMEAVNSRRLHYLIGNCLKSTFYSCTQTISSHYVMHLGRQFIFDVGFWPMVSDFINIVSHDCVVLAICHDETFLRLWLSVVKLIQFIDIYIRRSSQVQRENTRRYLTSYTLELEVNDNAMWNFWIHLIKEHRRLECELYFKSIISVIATHLTDFVGPSMKFQFRLQTRGGIAGGSVSPTLSQPSFLFVANNDAPTPLMDTEFDETTQEMMLLQEIPNDMENVDEEFIFDEGIFATPIINTQGEDEEDEDETLIENFEQDETLMVHLVQVPGPSYSSNSTPHSSTVKAYDWYDVLTFHLPLFRQAAVFWSTLHVWHGEPIAKLGQMVVDTLQKEIDNSKENVTLSSMKTNNLIKIWCTYIARTIMGAGEVSSNIWVYNGMNIRRSHIFYRDSRYCHSLSDLDILSIQLLSSLITSKELLGIFKHSRCLLYGFDWEKLYYVNNVGLSEDKAKNALHAWLITMALLLDMRTFWTKSERGGEVRKELVCCLSIKPRKRSDLNDRMPELPGLNQPFGVESDTASDALLNELATYTAPRHDSHTGVMHSGVYTIKSKVLLEEFDALFQFLRHPDRREYAEGLQNFFKVYCQENGLENTTLFWPPYHLPSPLPEGLNNLNDILLEEEFFSMIFRILFWFSHPSVDLVSEESLSLTVHLLRRCIFYCDEKKMSYIWNTHPLRYLSRKRRILPQVASNDQISDLVKSDSSVDKDSICSLLIKAHAALHTKVSLPKFTNKTPVIYRPPFSPSRTSNCQRPQMASFKELLIGDGEFHVNRLLDLMFWTREEIAHRICKSLLYLNIPRQEVYPDSVPSNSDNLPDISLAKNWQADVESMDIERTSGGASQSISHETLATKRASPTHDQQEDELEAKKRKARERQLKILERMAAKQTAFAEKISTQVPDVETASQGSHEEVKQTGGPSCETGDSPLVQNVEEISVTCVICQLDVIPSHSDSDDCLHILSRRAISSFSDLYRYQSGVRVLTVDYLHQITKAPCIDNRLSRLIKLMDMSPSNSSAPGVGNNVTPNIEGDPDGTPDIASVKVTPIIVSPYSSSSSQNNPEILSRMLLRQLTPGSHLNLSSQSKSSTDNDSMLWNDLSLKGQGIFHSNAPAGGLFPHLRCYSAWQTCGHVAHEKCFQQYQRSIDRSGIHLNSIRLLVCPLCRREVNWHRSLAVIPRSHYPSEIMWKSCEQWGGPVPKSTIDLRDFDEISCTPCDVFEAYFIALRAITAQIECELSCIILFPNELQRIQRKCHWIELVYDTCETVEMIISKQCRQMPLLSLLYAMETPQQSSEILHQLIRDYLPGTSLLTLDPVDIFLFSLIFDVPCEKTFYQSLARAYNLALCRALFLIVRDFSQTEREAWMKNIWTNTQTAVQLVVQMLQVYQQQQQQQPSAGEHKNSDNQQERIVTVGYVKSQIQIHLLRLLRVAAQCYSHGQWYPRWCERSLSINTTQTTDNNTWPLATPEPLDRNHLLREMNNWDEVNHEFVYLCSYMNVVPRPESWNQLKTELDPTSISLVNRSYLDTIMTLFVPPLLTFTSQSVELALTIGTELFPPRLISLPETFDEIFLPLHRVKCPNYQANAKPPLNSCSEHNSQSYNYLCLHCGRLVCAVCKFVCHNVVVDQRSLTEIYQHAVDCCGHWGVYLELFSSHIIIVHDAQHSRWGAVHLDAYGEEDIGLVRGKPLFLDRTRYSLLEKQWICNDLASNLKHWSKAVLAQG